MHGLDTHMRIYKGPLDGKDRFVNYTWPNASVGQELYDSDEFDIIYQD